jgi:tetratricopeptide (TPR) repeat protein
MKASCAEHGFCWQIARLFAALVVAALLPATSVAQLSPEDIGAASDAMDESDFDRARSLLDAMMAGNPDDPAVLFVRGKWAFHQGDYDVALALLDQALVSGGENATIRGLRELVATTLETLDGFATYTTRDGLFEITYEAERDEVIIPWAEETLEAAYYEIGYDIGYWPEPPIRVEIVPRAIMLSRISSLSEEAIRTSGTIGLCKYNKLMFTSPRGTARGYGWRDTLAHEYVHYAMQHQVRRELPIWFHEAMAKYLEGRWTGTRDIELPPSREDLLAERIAADDLVTFDEMHPSMAYLEAEDASTAYAQVFTIVEFLVERRGVPVIRELLAELATGTAIEAAFERVLGESFDAFTASWMVHLRARPRIELPGSFRDEAIEILDEGVTVVEEEGSGNVEARDYMRLGELLRARGVPDAAIEEYRKAELLVGNTDPVLQNALARAYLDVTRAADALRALADVGQWYPDYYVTFLHLGEALNRLGEHREALVPLVQAIGVNPFDPAVHRELAVAYEALGELELARRAREDEQRVSH